MASIFLSYAREDAATAKALARCLERAGHSVWWDRHIQGGSEYAGEIEAALRRADVVLVLWSQASVHSAWVRDEAAEGRESGRLLPVVLDGSSPPLGFRQLQSISLAGWSGRGNPPGYQELLSAVSARAGNDRTDEAAPEEGRVPRHRRAVLLGLGLLAALLAALGGWWLLKDSGEASKAPVLAVLPFADLSPEGDRAYFAEGVAEAILTVLAKEPGIRVVGRSTAQQLQTAGPDAEKMRRALGITHVLEGSARLAGEQLRMSVRLISAADGRQLWAEEYQRRLDNVFAVQDEIGRAVAQRLKGSFDAGGTQVQTSADAYTLYLAARAKMRDRRLSSLKDAFRTAQRLLAADPDYAPGHALYSELVWHLSSENYGTLPTKQARAVAQRHARRAIQLAPEAADGYAALGMTSTGKLARNSLSKAIRLDPARAELRLWLSDEYERTGRQDDALKQLTAGLEMEPLLGPLAARYAFLLAASNRYEEAEAAISKFQRNGGSVGVANRVRADIAAYYKGDYSEAIRLGRAALAADPQTPLASGSLAGAYHMIGLMNSARAMAADLPSYSRLSIGGDRDRLLAQVRRDGERIWDQADADVAIDALAVDRDWAALEALFDANRNATELVCSDHRPWTVELGINLAQALKVRNREEESRALLACIDRILAIQSRGKLRSSYSPQSAIFLMSAQVEALRGRPDRAFALLNRGMEHGLRTPYGKGISEFPAFDGFQKSESYRRVDARLKSLTAQERAQTLSLLSN